MVLYGFLAFFGVIFAVNGLFVYFALDSWPGLRFENAYERGVNYNRILAAAESQAALKWTADLSVTPAADGRQRISVRMTRRDGSVIPGLNVQIDFSRLTHENDDFSVTVREGENGAYQALYRFPGPGRWMAEITAGDADGRTFRLVHDFTIEK